MTVSLLKSNIPAPSLDWPDRPKVSPTITGIGTAVPTAYDQRELWEEAAKDHFRGDSLAEAIWLASGVSTRHLAVPREFAKVASTWSTGERMGRYLEYALPIATSAARKALESASLQPSDLGMFCVASCTGYVTPGIDILVAEALGMDPGVRRMMIGHMGCHAAVPGMGSVAEYVAVREKPAMLLCVEIPSLHAQPPCSRDDGLSHDVVDQMISHALFADAASAIVVQPVAGSGSFGTGLQVVDIASATDVASKGHMTWTITDLGFRMHLSTRVPRALARQVGNAVDSILEANHLCRDDIAGYAIHPGGPQVIRTVGKELGLSAEEMEASYDTLRDFGNCSSATILMVIDNLVRSGHTEKGEYFLAMAFGPGLTMYTALLRSEQAIPSFPRPGTESSW